MYLSIYFYLWNFDFFFFFAKKNSKFINITQFHSFLHLFFFLALILVVHCSSDKSFEDVIYPKGDHDAVTISKRDLELLEPETFINDTIIDFYIL